MNDRLYRSRDERIFAGVAGGVAARLDLDPSLVRVAWVVLMFVSGGLFFLLYIVMAIVVPMEPAGADRWAAWDATPGPGAVPGWTPPAAPASAPAGPAAAAFTPAAGWPPGPHEPSASAPAAGPDAPPPAGPDAPAAAVPDAPSAAWPDEQPAPVAALTGPPPAPSVPPAPPPWAIPPRRHRRERSGSGAMIIGILLVLLGTFFLLRTFVPELELGAFWPAILVVVGVALLLGSIRPGSSD